MIPANLKYIKTHEWFLFNNKSITVGLTKYIVDRLDKLIFLDLPKAGEEILSGICFGEVESLHMLLDITSPISGEIIAVNERLYDSLDALSKDPYNNGWLIKFISNETHLLDNMMNADAYAKHISKLQLASSQRHGKRKSRVSKGKRRS